MKKTALALFLAMIICGPLWAAGDIVDCAGKRYDTPKKCVDNAPPINIAKCQAMKRCMSSPTGCRALYYDQYKQLYNQAVFGLPTMGPQEGRAVLARHVLAHFYGIDPETVRIELVDTDAFWAQYQLGSGKNPLYYVANPIFAASPALLVSILGHETIHRQQDQLTFVKVDGKKVEMQGLDFAKKAFFELEASMWENGDASYPWKFGPSKVAGCLLPEEVEESMNTLSCREWQTRRAIEKIRELPVGYPERRMKQLEDFLWYNPWTASYWIPQHPEWKKITAGTRPTYCGPEYDK